MLTILDSLVFHKPQPQGREIAFIDAALPHYQSLVAGVRAGVEVFLLDADTDGVEQISRILDSQRSISTVHLISHGVPGGLILGNTLLNLKTLYHYTPQIWGWSKALTANAELLIYGCEVAQGFDGQRLLYSLSELTGANIAASATKTGNAALGGDWQLEVQLGTITATLALQPEAIAAYQAVFAPGDLDSKFGSSGKIISNLGGAESVNTVLTQPDGKAIAVATSVTVAADGTRNTNLVLSRYNADGAIDTSFGTSGKTSSLLASGNSSFADVYGAVRQTDGKLLVLAYDSTGTIPGYVLQRYNSNGTLDTTFGSSGKVNVLNTTTTGLSPSSLMLQSDGKLLIVGDPFSSAFDTGVVRYNADGSLDTSFDGDGIATAQLGSNVFGGTSIDTALLQADGKLLAAGEDSNNGFLLARFNSNGSLDTSFSSDGKATILFGSDGFNDRINTIAQQTDGKILVAGAADGDFAVARYNADGSLDTSFSADGLRKIDIGETSSDNDSITKIVLQPDGKILLVGSSEGNFAVARLNADGSTDTTFGKNGKVLTDFGADGDTAANLILQPDGKALVIGNGGEDGDVLLARYQLNDNPNFAVNSAAAIAPSEIDFGSNPGVERQGTSKVDKLAGSKKDDLLDGDAGNDKLTGKGGNDRIFGQSGNDQSQGGGGKDLLDGGTGNDQLSGQGGDDQLVGGVGKDTLTGGGGKDLFVYKTVTDGVDKITDFKVGQDLLDLSTIFTRPEFTGQSASARLSEFVQLIQIGSDTQVQIDQDGNGTGTVFNTLAVLKNVVANTVKTNSFVI